MKTIKIFVSVPMKGRTEEEIREQIQRLYKKNTEGCSGDHTATETLINFELIDTFITETPPEGIIPKYWYREKSVEMLLQADVVIMGSNYDEAPGCMMELQLAQFLGKMITFE